MKRLNILFLLLLFCGCDTPFFDGEKLPSYKNYNFRKSTDLIYTKPFEKKFSVRFDGVPFRLAMQILSDESGTPIVWASSLDEAAPVYGTFNQVSLAKILELISNRVGVTASEIGGAYWIGQARKEERYICVTRIPPVDKTRLTEQLHLICSADGNIMILGSSLLICDRYDNIRRIIDAIELVRQNNDKTYVAEVFFIRSTETNFIKLVGDLQINQIDVFSSSFNMDELFKMFVDVDGNNGWSVIDQRPTLLLSEGRETIFEDGSEIFREDRTVSDAGTSSVSGYSKFTDGTKLTLLLNRVSNRSYAVDFDLSVGSFAAVDRNGSIPPQTRSSLKTSGLLVQDGKVYYIGSIKKKTRSQGIGLISLDHSRGQELLTIWLRVSEVRDVQ